MKIELDVDPGQLGKSLADIMGALTEDEKRGMAKNALEAWLKDPYDVERATRERWAIEQVKEKASKDYQPVRTDNEARDNYRFREMMDSWKSSKEKMIEAITKEIIDHYKAEVAKVVQSDPRIQAMKEDVTKVMLETFPKIAHDAMAIFVAQNFQNMLAATSMLQVRVDQMGMDTKQVSDRLMQIAHRIGIG